MRSLLSRSALALGALAFAAACSDQAPLTAPDVGTPLFALGPTGDAGAVQITVESNATTTKFCGYVDAYNSAPVACAPGVAATATIVNPGWAAPLGSSVWVASNGHGGDYQEGNETGSYTYQTTFHIDAGKLTPSLNVSTLSDNHTQVFLNSCDLGTGPVETGYAGDQIFSTNNASCFNMGAGAAGDNVIKFVVTNVRVQEQANCTLPPDPYNFGGYDTADCDNPTGLDFQARVRYSEPVIVNDQGCSHGFWKNKGFKSGLWATGTPAYDPNAKLNTIFTFPLAYAAAGNRTLMQAETDGGGGITNLMRQAVAALLNAASSSVNYPLTTAQIISQVNAAMASGSTAVNNLATTLDGYNNLHKASICAD